MENDTKIYASGIPVYCSHSAIVSITSLISNPRNPNKHPEKQIKLLAAIISEQGWRQPIKISNQSGFVVSGHGRLQAAQLLGVTEVPIDRQDYDNPALEWADLIADNRIAELAETDADLLKDLLEEIDNGAVNMQLTGFDEKELEKLMTQYHTGQAEEARKKLQERFLVPPFSVLDTKQGYWRERKEAWINLGIKGEEGRGDNLLHFSEACMNQQQKGKAYGVCLETGIGEKYGRKEMPGTSVFDPVLCEVVYRWFCPPGGHVLDPFAGEATKGIVAGYLGLNYTGIELRQEQVDINYRQANKIGVSPNWVCGDSGLIGKLLPYGQDYDLIFTSPPYYDLEIYSKNEKDGSAFETYEKFMAWYNDIFMQACSRLRDNRFLVIKVGEVRDKKSGIYRNFVGDNIACFKDICGLAYYNELVLITAIGSLPIRAGKIFASSRKVGKTHQNVLVFFKGDPKKIKEIYPEEIEYGEIADDTGGSEVVTEYGD